LLVLSPSPTTPALDPSPQLLPPLRCRSRVNPRFPRSRQAAPPRASLLLRPILFL
jgi:hypothetical protein